MSYPTSPTNNQVYKNMIYDTDRWRHLGKVTSFPGINYNLTANAPIAVFNLAGIHDGSYLIEINWAYFYNVVLASAVDTAVCIWHGKSSGILSVHSTASLYNSAPATSLTLNTMLHHTTAGVPTFTIDSDNSLGYYGNPAIYMSVTFTGSVVGLSATIKEIL